MTQSHPHSTSCFHASIHTDTWVVCVYVHVMACLCVCVIFISVYLFVQLVACLYFRLEFVSLSFCLCSDLVFVYMSSYSELCLFVFVLVSTCEGMDVHVCVSKCT